MDKADDECQDGSPRKTRGGTLNRRQYELFVEFLDTKIRPPHHELKSADLVDETLKCMKPGIYGRFKAWAKRMILRPTDKVLLFAKSGKEIICTEDFEPVVRRLNISPVGTHRSFAVTLKMIRQKYTTGKRQFGMSEDTVREILFTCTSATCPCTKMKKIIEDVEVDEHRDELKEISVQASDSQSSTIILSDGKSESPDVDEIKVVSSGPKTKPTAQPLSSPPKHVVKTKRQRKVSDTRKEGKKNSSVSYFTMLNLQDIAKLATKAPGSSDQQDTPVVKNVVTFRPYMQGLNSAGTSTAVSSASPSGLLPCVPRNIIASPSSSSAASNPFSVDYQSIAIGPLHGHITTASTSANCIFSSTATIRLSAGIGQLSNIHKTKKKPYPTVLVPNYYAQQWELFRNSHPMLAESPPEKSIESRLTALDGRHRAGVPMVGDVVPNAASERPESRASTSFHDQKEDLPNKEIWYSYEDINQQPHKYKKLIGVIGDMRNDIKQTSVGMKPSVERLKRKIAVAEGMLSRCRDVAMAQGKKLCNCPKKILS